MKSLAEDIEGELIIESINGTKIGVCFYASLPFYEGNTMLISENSCSLKK
ncbi:MAG: hypothetical protein ABI285_03905 [Ginsengibacter sp.]